MAESQTQQWLEQSRQAWDERAEMFDAMSTANAQGEDRKRELDFVCDALGIETGARVLDAGCGAGQFAIAFAERGYLLDGIDLSPEMIGRARRHADEAGVEVQFTVGDLAALDAPDGAYDAIVARMALQFSPHLSAVLGEFERVSRTGASCWLSVPGALAPMYRDSWERFVAEQPPAVNYIVPWELIQVLEHRGWTILKQWGTFDTVATVGANVASEIDIAALPLPLQQAAATVWNMIVRVPQRGMGTALGRT